MNAPKFIVLWPGNGIFGGFERADVLACALAENRSLGEAKIGQLNEGGWSITYSPITQEEVRAIAFPKLNVPVHLDNPAASFQEAAA